MSDNKIEVQFGATTDGVEKGAATAASAIESSMARMSTAMNGVHGAVTSLHAGFTSAFDGMQGTMAKFNNAMMAVENMLAGGKMFKAVIADSMAFTGEVTKLSKALGMSTAEASELNVALKLTGQTAEEFIGITMKLLRQVNSNEKGLQALGLETRNAHGDLKPLMEITKEAGAMLQDFKEGIDRDAAAMYFFGRGAAEAMGILKLNNDVMARAKVLAEEYGLKIGPEGVANAKQFKMAQAEVNLLFEAMTEKVGTALIPVLTKLSGYLSQVGPSAVEAFSWALKQLIQFLEETAMIFTQVAIRAVQMFDDIVSVAVQVAGVVKAALNFDMDGIKTAWRQGNNEVESHAIAATSAIETANENASARVAKMWAKEAAGIDGGGAGGKGTRAFHKPEDGGSGPEKEDNRTALWKAGLAAKLDAEGNYFRDATAETAKFWEGVSTMENLSVKERIAINGELFHLHKKLANDQRNVSLEEAEQRKHMALSEVDMGREKTSSLLALGQISATEAVRQTAMQNERQFAIERATLDEKLALVKEEGIARTKLLSDMAALEAKHNLTALKDVDATAKATHKSWQDALSPITDSFSKVAAGLMNGTMTIKSALHGMFTSIVTDYAQMGIKLAAQWLVNEAVKTAATAAGATTRGGIEAGAAAESIAIWAGAAIANVLASAYQAMAGAYAAIVSIPYVGPFLAPVAAGAAFVAVAGLASSIHSAEGGFDIPAGVNPVTQLHEKEMVLPKAQAEAVRQMAEGGGGGGTNITISAHPMPGNYFMVHRDQLVKALKSAQRDNAWSPA